MRKNLFDLNDLTILNNKQLEERIYNDENYYYSLDEHAINNLLYEIGYSDDNLSKFVKNTMDYVKEHGIYELNDNDINKALEILKSQIYELHITNNKEIVLLFGLPGAGKSTIIKNIKKHYSKSNFYLVDSDEFKTGLKNNNGEYILEPYQDPKLKGIDVEFIHKAIANLAKIFLEVLLKEGYDIISPKIGDDIDSIFKLLEDFKNRGYKVYIHFVYCTVKTSLERNLFRFKNSNESYRRLVPVKKILDIGYKPFYNFLIIFKEKICDEYFMWDGENFSNKDPLLEFINNRS